jgi:hypothetical protein
VAKAKIIDRDRGMRELMRMAERINYEKPHVVVGITGKRGSKQHAGGVGATVVDIGAAHEFGAGNVPRRSFIRATVDRNETIYREAIRKAFRATVLHAARNDKTWNYKNSVALRRLGLRVEGDIKQYIADGIEPANSPQTIARKKSSKPLIDTGQLRASIASEIRKGSTP